MSKSRTVSKTELPDEFQEFYNVLFKGGKEALSKVDTQPYQGQRVAEYNKSLTSSDAMLRRLSSQLNGLGNPLLQMGKDTIAGKYLNAESNPYLQSAIGAAIDPLQERLLGEIIPTISSAAQQQGAYGGARQGILEASANDDWMKNAGQISSGMAYKNYGDERQNQMNAGNVLSQGAGLNALSPGFLQQAGQNQFGYDQSLIDARMQQFNEAKTAPFAGLNQYAALMQGGPAPGGTTTTTGGGPSAGQNAASGTLGLLSMILPFLGPVGAVAGTGLGALSTGMNAGAQNQQTFQNDTILPKQNVNLY